jgi:hypothetical protein
VELRCELSPLVFAELYRLLDADPRLTDLLAERLKEIDLDHDWLREAVAAYEGRWESDVAMLHDHGSAAQPVGLPSDHALLASWVLAALRTENPCDELSDQLRGRVADRANNDIPHLADLPSCLVPRVIAWTLGMVVGRFDINFPVIPAQMPIDIEVELAYRGLVEHVIHLAEVQEPWPEVMCSSTLWRAAGLAEGLQPDANGPQAAINQLMAAIRHTTPEYQYERLRKHWIGFIEHRNALTHVAPSAGKPRFSDSVRIACASDHVVPTVMGVTNFVFQKISQELMGPSGKSVRSGLWEHVLRYEIGAF